MSSPNLPWGAAAPEAPPSPSEAPTDTADAPEKKLSLGTKLFFVFAAVALVVIAAGFAIHVPYTTISPGATVKLVDQIQISGAKTYPTPRGDIRLLFVREQNHVNLWQYLAAQFESDTDVIKDQTVTGGKSPQQVQQEAIDQMTEAKQSATKVALTAAGYKVGNQVVVRSTLPGLPAADVLRAGDIIREADGRPVNTNTDLREAVARHRVGDHVTLVVERNNAPVTLQVPVALQDNRRVIGVNIDDKFTFPFPVTVDTRGIGGPSGGLAMTLAIYDDLTPGDLTGGKRVAVTGEILDDGSVGEIGGIEQKAAAARAAGARLFIVPRCNEQLDPPDVLASCKKDLERAIKRAGSKVKVVPVSTFQEALQVLRDNGGDAPG